MATINRVQKSSANVSIPNLTDSTIFDNGTNIELDGNVTVHTKSWYPGQEAKVNLGDPNHYIKAIHNEGVRIGSYGVPDIITIKQVSGLVGIGTTTPTEKLEVNGKIRVAAGQHSVTIEENDIYFNRADSHSYIKHIQNDLGAIYLQAGTSAGNKLGVNEYGVKIGYALIASNQPGDPLLTVEGDAKISGNLEHDGSNVGFFSAAPTSKKTVTGSKGGNAALASLLAALASYGLVTDSTT